MNMTVIGITADNKNNTAASGTYECAAAYSRAVADAGGVPVMLPHVLERVAEYAAWCDGFILTGGVDPDTSVFQRGDPMHPKAKRMDPQRQAFEVGLLEHLAKAKPETACLGVCLGMQLMALHAGGKLNQHLPDTHETHAMHAQNSEHAIKVLAPTRGGLSPDLRGRVVSHHVQAVRDSGAMRVVAAAPDGIIEAIDDPTRGFYLGVQWHPERGGEGPLNRGLIGALVDAARRGT